MSDLRVDEREFEGLLEGVLVERCAAVPAGLEQRLLARFAQQEEWMRASERRPFAFAEAVKTQRSGMSTWFAVGAHALVLVLVFALAERHMATVRMSKEVMLSEVLTPPPPVLPRAEGLHGGGGQHDVAAVSQGRLPKLEREPLLAPKIPPAEDPRLVVEPSVVVQKDLKMADNTMPNLGLPNSSVQGVSMGHGEGGGLGQGNGAGIGPGSGGNAGGGAMHIGGSVLAPVVLLQVDPEFSEEARRAKFSGAVKVYLWVDERGIPSHVRVVQGVGMGLDEKAVEAVRQYRFKPATQNGKPVKVDLYVEVNFTIY